MKKLGFVILLFLSVPCFAQTPQPTSVPMKKLMILPFANLSDTNAFATSGNLQQLVFRSLYTFLGIIPDLDTPDPADLTNIVWSESTVPQIALSNQAQFVVFGSYEYSGTEADTKVALKLQVWSKIDNGIVISETYRASLGLEVIDAIDSMLAAIVGNLLNVSMNVASIRFSKFSIGTEPHFIYINRKLITIATNNDFFLNLKVLADRDYDVQIRRSDNRKVVYESSFHLGEGQSTNISITASGMVHVLPIRDRRNNRNYFMLLNDQLVLENETLTNLPAGLDYTLRLVVNQSNVVFTNHFKLLNGEVHTVEPRESTLKWLYSRVYLLGGYEDIVSLSTTASADIQNSGINYGGGYGIIMQFTDKLWLGLNIEAAFFGKYAELTDPIIHDTGTMSILRMSPSLDIGFYFIGSKQTDWRFGAGATAGIDAYLLYINTLTSPLQFNNGAANHTYSSFYGGGFIQADYRILFLRASLLTGIDGSQFETDDLFVPDSGIQLNLEAGLKF